MRRKRKARFFRNGKGNVGVEGLTILVVMVILAISGLFGYKIYEELNADLQNDTTIGAEAKSSSAGLFKVYPSLLDNMFLFIFVMLVIFALVAAFIIDTHPIFFAITIVLLLSVFVVSMFLGNAYDDIASDAELAPYANNLPYINWIMTHILELIIGVSFMIAIALFAKFRLA